MKKDLLAFAAFPLAALLLAGTANALAGPGRRLAWTGRPPEELPMLPVTSPAPAAALASAGEPAPTRPASAAVAKAERLASERLASERLASGRPTSTSGSPAPALAPATPQAPATAGAAQEIDGTAAFQAWQSGALFLDARRTSDYRAGHIRGAHSAPVWEAELEEALVRFEALSGAQAQTPLVLYCTGGDCRDSHLLAGRLWSRGFRNLRIYRDGFQDWTAQGRPVQQGEQP